MPAYIPPCSGHLLNLEALLDPQFWNHWDILFQLSSVTDYYTHLNSHKNLSFKDTNTRNHFELEKMFVNFHSLIKPFQPCCMNTKVGIGGTKTNSN